MILILSYLIPVLSDIYSEKPKAMINTAKQVSKLLDYLSSNPHA